jgi:hypothetical protein
MEAFAGALTSYLTIPRITAKHFSCTARAQAQFDKPAARRSHRQLLEICKNANADFIPAQEAKREMAALQASS